MVELAAAIRGSRTGEQRPQIAPVSSCDQLSGSQRVEGITHTYSSVMRALSAFAISASASTRSVPIRSGACLARSAHVVRQACSNARQAGKSRAASRATRANAADTAGMASHPRSPAGWRRALIWRTKLGCGEARIKRSEVSTIEEAFRAARLRSGTLRTSNNRRAATARVSGSSSAVGQLQPLATSPRAAAARTASSAQLQGRSAR